MKSLLKLALSFSVLTVLAAGCCAACGGKDGKCADPNAADCGKTAVRTAVTPDGEVLYVVAVWDAESTCDAPRSACKTAQCWQTRDGKTYCVKPLKDCPKQGKDCPVKEHYKNKDGKVACVDTDARAVCNGQKKNWCAKQVKACPMAGEKACPAKEHVKLSDGKAGCAAADVKADVKADAKEAAPQNAPKGTDSPNAAMSTGAQPAAPTMDDEVEEDAFFVVSAI